MNQQKQLQLQQPDSAVRSHELIKRRFFEKLERRESMNLARGTIGAAAAGAATANKQNELEQVRRQLHQQHQQLQSIFASSFGENQGAGGSVSNAKVDSVNEADGAGTDADDAEATSLETIITNNFKSNGTLVTATVAQALCETAAQEEPPPLDDSKIDDDDEQQVEEGRAGVSNEDDHERQQQQRQSSGGQCRVDHDDVSSALLNLQETARVEQASGFSPLVQQQKRQPSKRDLHDGLLLLPLEDAREVGEHEGLRLLQSGPTAQQQQQRGEQREQYANPSSWPSDSSQGNHLVRRPSSGNNVNHDQTDGHCRDLTYSLHATQMFTGRGGNHFGDVKNNVDGRINFVDRSTSGGHDDLIEPLRQEDSKMQQPRKILLDQETTSKKYGNDNICDTDQRQAIVVISSPTIERAIEEDVGSSCSSSGFGASVSAGSSSASSSSDGHHHRHHHLSADDKESMLDNLRGQNDHYRRPNSVGYVVGQDGEILESKSQSEMGADEIAKFEIVVGRHDDPDSTGPYKQILSVDYNQAYQDDDEDDNDGNGGGRPLLHVENHGYGSLVNGCRTITIAAGATMRNQTDRRRWPLVDASEVSSELDLYSNRQYVNLPTDSVTNSAETQDSSTATAGYATVRAQQPLVHNSRGQSAGLANIPSTGNNRYSTDHQPDVKLNSNNNDQHHSTTTTMMTMKSTTATKTRGELEGRESSLSGHSSSSSSANTGGFSKLPPVRLIDHHFANNFESSKAPPGREPKSLPQSSLLLLPSSSSLMEESNSMQQQSKKSPSFLKRFGSLVSRAFTLNSSSGGGGEFGSSGSNFDYHNHGIRGNITQANAGSGGGSRLEMQHQQSASSESMPPLKKQELHELRNGAGSQAEHKSAENAIGGSRQGGVDNNNETHSPKLADNSNLRGERLNLNPLKGPVVVAGNKPSSIMAQADLVILSSKHSKNNQLASRAKNLTATDDDHHHYGAASQRLRRDPIEGSGNLRNCRPRSDDKFLARMKHHRSRNACANESRKLAHRTSATYLSRRSTSSTSCSSLTSLDNSSLTSTSSTRDLTHRAGVPSSSSRLRRQRSAKRTSSLSDDLESLLSPSEVVSAQRIREDQLYPTEKCDKNRATAATTTTTTNLTQKRRPIMNKNHETDRESNKGRMNASDNINKSQRDQASSKSRSIMRWFNATGGSASSSPSPLMADSMQKDDCNSIRYDPTGWACETRREPQGLIDPSHANRGYKLDCSTGNSKILRRLSKENSGTLNVRGQPTSLIYTSLNQHSRSLHSDNEQPKQSWRKRMDADRSSPDHKDKPNDEELVVIDGKCQSLNIYSNLLRNYVKRRNHRGHHHHHHRHHHQHTGHHNRGHHHHHYHAHSSSNSSNHHHHHHNKHSSSSRHAHCSSSTETGATTTRCGQQRCGSPDRACSYSSERLVAGSGKTHGDKASVWGQLIKINKSDGSQVIELQRAPGRSWGFFVARGAINNKKGIFISRMHDSSTGNSLSGLLSIGDQILSIDNYIIEPDFDILRVNQMISKKTEILLGVKPFKG